MDEKDDSIHTSSCRARFSVDCQLVQRPITTSGLANHALVSKISACSTPIAGSRGAQKETPDCASRSMVLLLAPYLYYNFESVSVLRRGDWVWCAEYHIVHGHILGQEQRLRPERRQLSALSKHHICLQMSGKLRQSASSESLRHWRPSHYLYPASHRGSERYSELGRQRLLQR